MNKIGIPGINMLLQKKYSKSVYTTQKHIQQKLLFQSFFLQFLSRRGATETASYMGDFKVNNSQHSIA